MSKRKQVEKKKKLEVKKETLRKMEMKPEQLQHVAGGVTGNYPSGTHYC